MLRFRTYYIPTILMYLKVLYLCLYQVVTQLVYIKSEQENLLKKLLGKNKITEHLIPILTLITQMLFKGGLSGLRQLFGN